MRPSSSPGDPGLFDGVLARGEVRREVSDEAWLRSMLETEAALAQVWAELDRIPASHAAAIAAVCEPERYDTSTIGRAAAEHGNPVLPLVQAIRAIVPTEMANSVHFGATSQDILDTASMLIAHRSLGHVLESLRGAKGAAARLAQVYRETPMAGRTLLQRAEPITFGMTAAGWLVALGEAFSRLAQVRETRLAVQLGGAVGRLTGYPAQKLAGKLGLQAPQWPWHTNRSRVCDLAGALGGACGVVGKVARDVTLLAQSEVGEVSEAHPGSSSAMPHKRNPVAAISAVACAMQAPGLVATLLAAMVQEHGRAAGAWHAEWRPLRELLISTGSAASWLHACLEGLQVNEAALAANVAGLGVADLAACAAFVDLALEAYG
jgi:3-carboxy-cis,cis-muconate cycloisomerase